LVDTLRANHLGAYGYGRPTSPRIDAFAAEGTLFENAVTTAPWTLPAMGTIWTSLYPSVHGATTRSNESALLRDPKSFRPLAVLDPSRTTLAQILHANRIRTAGFVDGVYPGAIFGFARGFDLFVEDGPTGARMNVEAALAWLDSEKPEQFFVYIHLVDVHSPYMPTGIPPELARGTDEESKRAVKILQEEQKRFGQFEFDPGYQGTVDGSHDSLTRLRAAAPDPPPRDVAHVVALYDRSIAYTDYWIGQLIDGLRERRLYDDTLVVVTADHGEEFFDHGALEHGVNQYDEVMKVPLIMRAPRVGHGLRVKEQVGLLDFMPTVLDFFGLAAPSDLQGISLRPAFTGAALPERTLFSEADQSTRVKAMRTNAFKYIRNGKRSEVYDLAADAAEKQNLCDPSSANCADFAQQLHGWEEEMTRVAAAKPTPGEASIDQAARERLRALGYTD
jgi:arylsulfatase A-like enzyme